MKQCQDCHRINSATELFCLTCGSANMENVGDDLPFSNKSDIFIVIFVT